MGDNSQRRAFITGATGVLGNVLVRKLLGLGWTVFALHRASSNVSALRDLGVELVEGDIADDNGLKGKVPANVDAFFHVAADMSVWSRGDARQTRINVLGARNAVEEALRAGVKRFILTSSTSAYGRHTVPINENTLSLAEGSYINYERTKRLAELEVLKGVEKGLDAVIVNPAAILGPGFTNGWGFIFKQIKAGYLNMQPPGTLVVNHLYDVADAHISAFHLGRTGHNYILTGDSVSCARVICKAAELMGIPLKERVASTRTLMMISKTFDFISKFTGKEPPITPEIVGLMSQHLVLNTTKAKTELGYRETPWEVALADMYNWLKNNGKI